MRIRSGFILDVYKRQRVGISSSTLAKMSKGEIVSLTVLEKICDELNCDFGDLISYDRKGAKK